MDKNYFISTLFATMSCSTVALSTEPSIDGRDILCPRQSIEIPVEQYPYQLSLQKSMYISSIPMKDMEDIEILVSFAKSFMTNEVTIDEEIQRVIEEKFWDML